MNDIKKQISFIKEKGGYATLDEICKAYSKKYTMFITPEHKDVIRRTLNRYPELVTNKGNDVYSLKEEKKMVDEEKIEVTVQEKRFGNKVYTMVKSKNYDITMLWCDEFKDETLKDITRARVVGWVHGVDWELDEDFVKTCESCGTVCFYNDEENESMFSKVVIGKSINIDKEIGILKGGLDAIINEKPIGNTLYTSVDIPELALTFVYMSIYSDENFDELEDRNFIGFFNGDLIVNDELISECNKLNLCVPEKTCDNIRMSAEENLNKVMNEKIGKYHINDKEPENEFVEWILSSMPKEIITEDFDEEIKGNVSNWFTTNGVGKTVRTLEDYLKSPIISKVVDNICNDIEKHYDLVK